ncbi:MULTISPECIES: hypothetical protein [Flavobacteriaceae]|uniref:hypothetical protein n=1 Tax=Flavobacteriaceae TaxID=49546 RepID=UPI00149325BE|nr:MULTISPECIES: hypothetical protein [Allomuricauda]MDC6366567.1 hypothetical protein [Muricauda sp. AC10]
MRSKLIYIVVFAMGFHSAMNAQFNEYKYIIVPKKFDAFKQENKHQTSTMLKHLLTQKGFNAVYEDALPVDLVSNRCLGLLADFLDKSSMFTTKVNVVFKDCQGIEVFRTIEGKSKSKEYKVAYREALKDAFTSFNGINYQYTPKEKVEEKPAEAPIIVSFKDDVKSLEKKPDPKVVIQEATPENQSYESKEPVASNFTKAEKVKEEAEAKVGAIEASSSEILYAQPVGGGYQLVDSTPKVVMKLQETSVDNIFLVDYQGANGMVFKKEGKWMLEYSKNGEKMSKELHIKF